MWLKNKLALALLSSTVLVQSNAFAEITGTDILNILVEEEIISEEKAKALAEKVRSRSNRENAEKEKADNASDTQPARVQYVPEFVKKGIQESVKNQVIAEIEDNVALRAREGGWVINQSPSWVNKVKITGDVRLRYQQDIFPDSNSLSMPVFNYNAINASGSLASEDRDQLVNITEDRERLRTRARLEVVGKPNKKVNVGFRFVTGNPDDPTSSNQTLGTYNQKYDSNFDLAYLELKDPGEKYRLIGGKFKNPWVSSGLIWDTDVTFEGIAASYSPRRLIASIYSRSLYNPFITVGAFPVQQISQTPLAGDVFAAPDDKWLYAVQLGNDFRFSLANSFSFSLAYYHFENVRGERNEPVGTNTNDPTAPPYFQFGNAVFNIANTGDANAFRYALASEFELINLNLNYTFSGMLKHDLGISADWVLNTAFDKEEISRITDTNVPERDQGYQIGLNFGSKQMVKWGDWNASFKYRYLEGDAVIDAFADSDFLLGGTNAEGYILRGDFALAKGTFASLKWITASELNAAQETNVEVDRLQLDFNAKF